MKMAYIKSIRIINKIKGSKKMKKDILNLLNNLRVEAAVVKNSKVYDHLNQTLRQQNLDNDLNDVMARYLGKAKSLSTNAKTKLKDANLELNKLQYPSLTSNDSGLKVAGSTQIDSALIFLSSKPSPETVRQTLKMATDLGRKDFVSYVLNSVLSTSTDPTDSEAMNLQTELKSLRSELFPSLPQLQNNVDECKVVLDVSNQMVRAIEKGFTGYIPEYAVKEFSQEEANSRIDDINASIPYWYAEKNTETMTEKVS